MGCIFELLSFIALLHCLHQHINPYWHGTLLHNHKIKSNADVGLWNGECNYRKHVCTIAIQAIAQMNADKEYVGSSRVHNHVSCSCEISVYSVRKRIYTTRMHIISRRCIPFIYGLMGKEYFRNLPFH